MFTESGVVVIDEDGQRGRRVGGDGRCGRWEARDRSDQVGEKDENEGGSEDRYMAFRAVADYVVHQTFQLFNKK